MLVCIIREKANSQEIEKMLIPLKTYIKVAVDTRLEILAGGGTMHADCEAVLLENGSRQPDIWGANWYPKTRKLEYEALINIRPRVGNRGMLIQDPEIQRQVEKVVRKLLEIS